MAHERGKPGGVAAGASAVNVDPFHATLDKALHGEAVLFAQTLATRIMCRTSDVAICAEADRDIRDGAIVIHVSASAPTLKTSIAGDVRITDRILEERAARDAEGVAREIMRDVFDALQAQVDRKLDEYLTDDAKAAIEERAASEPIPGMFDAMDRMSAWESRNPNPPPRRTDLIAEARARALDAIDQGGHARTTVGDADAAIRASRAGLFSADDALARIRRARNQGVKLPADQILDLHATHGDAFDALTYALGGVAPAVKRARDAAKRVAEACAAFKVETDASVPDGEVHARFGGRTVGKIKGLKASSVTIDDAHALGQSEELSMRCASCGGRATLRGGSFGMAGASYRCRSCGTTFDDCKQCRAIYARRSDNTCPRCGQERQEAKA